MRARAFLALFALAGANAPASDEVRVVSPRADSVSVTIYRDLFALITETRTVDLPAGPLTLVFDGVVDTLLPQSAMLADTGRNLRETNYSSERLTPDAMLMKSIGKTVMLTRTHRKTGRVRQTEATLVAAGPQGAIFRTSDGNEALHCSGLPEGLSFDDVPDGLGDEPALSIRLAAGTPGKRQIRVSYLAHGFAWRADYVANLAATQTQMELLGWISLHNFSATSFKDVEVQVVAGRLNVLDAEFNRGTGQFFGTQDFSTDDSLDYARDEAVQALREELDGPAMPDDQAARDLLGNQLLRLGECYPMGISSVESIVAEDIGSFPFGYLDTVRESMGVVEELEEVVVTGIRSSLAVRERLADYQLYRLPERTDLASRQSKQVAFLHKPAVKVERFYSVRIASEESMSLDFNYDFDNEPYPASIQVRWLNRESDGLGEPLPAGTVRFFESGDRGPVFAGDAKLRDSPVDTPIELSPGRSLDVAVTLDNIEEEPTPNPLMLLLRRIYLPLHWRIHNASPVPVAFEMRQGPMEELEELRVRRASIEPGRKAGDHVWRVTVPANGDATLSYELGGKFDPDMF